MPAHVKAQKLHLPGASNVIHDFLGCPALELENPTQVHLSRKLLVPIISSTYFLAFLAAICRVLQLLLLKLISASLLQESVQARKTRDNITISMT
jgi:hypothetical protein